MTDTLELIRELISECRKPYPEGVHGSRYADGYNDASNDIADRLFAILDASQGYVCVKADNPSALAYFTEYFVRNYPGPNTIISDPNWHAPRIFRAARHCLLAASKETNRE